MFYFVLAGTMGNLAVHNHPVNIRLFLYSFLVLILQFPQNLLAQNLVPNGDFEYHLSCPYTANLNGMIPPWRDYHIGTPDFFDSCATWPLWGVPANGHGYQLAASGHGYVGMAAYASPSTPSLVTEYIAAPITPMSIGTWYEASMSVSLRNISSNGCNGLGMWFYDNGPTTTINAPPPPAQPPTLNVVAQALFTNYGPITDTQSWVRLSTIFQADSAYDNIVVGKFNPPSGLIIAGTNTITPTYYYFDSIVVRLAPRVQNLFTDSMLCAGDIFLVPYAPRAGTVFNINNLFSVQLSNVNGGFSNGTTIIGTLASNVAGSISCVVPTTITPGSNYRLRVLANNPADSSDISAPISIGVTKPTKPLAANNSPLCSGTTLLLSATSMFTVSYKWTGPLNYSSTGQNNSISNAQVNHSGQYIITAYNYGCIAKDTTDVVVHQMPIPVTASSTSPVCENDSIHINCSNSSAGASYIWNGPAGFNTIQQNLFWNNTSLSVNGDYIVTATLGTFCVQKDTINVIVKPLPPNLATGTNAPLCEGDSLHIFANSSDTAVTYNWTGPVVFSSKDTVFIKAPLSACGIYYLVADLNGCILKDTLAVEINPLPANVKASSNSPLCAGDSLVINGTTSSNAVVFNWSGPDNFTGTLTTHVIYNTQPKHTGKYFLIATLGNKCSVTDSTTVIIKPMPLKPVIIADTVLCAGEILHFNADSTISDAGYLWTGPNNFDHDIIAVVVLNVTTPATGTYILTADKDGCIQRDTAEVLIKPKPEQPDISSNSPIQTGQNVYFNLSNPQTGTRYTWAGPNGFNSNIFNPVLFAPDTNYTGTYFITADLDGCMSTGLTYVQIDKKADTGLIFLYPSPNDGTFYLKGVFKTDQHIPLRIFDVNGQLVYADALQIQNKKLFATIPLKNRLASGEYLLHILVDGRKRVMRFTVVR